MSVTQAEGLPQGTGEVTTAGADPSIIAAAMDSSVQIDLGTIGDAEQPPTILSIEMTVRVADEFKQQKAEVVENEELAAAEKAASIVALTQAIGDGEGVDASEVAKIKAEVRHEILPDLFGPAFYREEGRKISTILRRSPAKRRDLVATLSHSNGLAPDVVDEVVERFIDSKLLRTSKKGDVSLSSGKSGRSLEMGELDTARHIRRMFEKVKVEINSLDDVDRLQEEHDERRRVDEVRIPTSQPSARLLPLNELRLGHQDGRSGLQLVRKWVDKLKDAPEAEKPGAVLVANLVQGDFAHTQSKKRGALTIGLDVMANQFKTAKLLFDELKKTGIPIIHSLGPDDHKTAYDYTVDVMTELRGLAKKGQNGGDRHINYYERNKLIQEPNFQHHLRFQIEYILPLCYRLGRRLRTAEDLDQETEGEVTRSEYLMLYDHIVLGEPLPESLGIDEDTIKGLGEWAGDTITVDDVDVVFETPEQERRFTYRHTESFSPETLLGNHSAAVIKKIGNLGTNGYALPDATITGRAQEAVYVTSSDVPVEILPGLTDPAQSINTSQYYRMVTGDPSLRAVALRKRFSAPTMVEFELSDNGDVIHRYINKDFLDMADSLPRTAVFELCDIQKGSPTSRSDYLVKYLSFILETAEIMPVAIQWTGDIIHGHIYPNFSDESQSIGLIKLASQKLAIRDMLLKAWGHPDIPVALLDAVIDVSVQQGNHDEVQKKRVPNNNDSNIDYLIYTMQKIFDRPGEESKVRHTAKFHTRSGTPVGTWMGTTHLGAYTIRSAHYHLNRGSKGESGGSPLYHAYQRAQGIGDEEDAHIYLGAHWHNEQSGMIGKKLIVVGGAFAEQSEFEDMFSYKARLAGTVLYLGGGLPPEVRFIHKEGFDRMSIKYGFFTPKNLAEHNYHDHPDFDPTKHAQYSNDDWPKSAIQQALNDMERRASQLVEYEAVMQNPNTYDEHGQPIQLNAATRRAFAFGKTALKFA